MNRVYNTMSQLPQIAKLYVKAIKKNLSVDENNDEHYIYSYYPENDMVEKIGEHEYKQIYYIVAASWNTQKHL